VSCTKRYYIRIWLNFIQNSSQLLLAISPLIVASIKTFGKAEFIFVAYTGFAILV